MFSFKASQAWRKNKMDESKHEIHSQVDAITAGTASMVNLTAGRNSGASLCSCNHAFFNNKKNSTETVCMLPVHVLSADINHRTLEVIE